MCVHFLADWYLLAISLQGNRQKTEEWCHLTRINTQTRTHTRLHINTHHYCSTRSIKSRQWDMWVHTHACMRTRAHVRAHTPASMSSNRDLTTHFIVEYTQRGPLSDVNVYVNRGWCKLRTPVCINTLTHSEGGCLALSYWEKHAHLHLLAAKPVGSTVP